MQACRVRRHSDINPNMETAIGHVCSMDGGRITVVVDAPVACRRCASGKGCGAGLLAGSAKSRRIDVIAPAGITFEIGDVVTLTLAPAQLLRAALIAYGLPLVALVGSAWLASGVAGGQDNPAAIGIVLAGMALGFLASRRILDRDASCRQFVPAIESRVVGEDQHGRH